MCVLLAFQHAEETGAAGPGGGTAVCDPLAGTGLGKPPGDARPRAGGGTAEDAPGGCTGPESGAVALRVARAGQHPHLALLAAPDRAPAQQHPLPHLQDDGAHLCPQPAQLQRLHPVSQQGLQPVRLQPQPASHRGNASLTPTLLSRFFKRVVEALWAVRERGSRGFLPPRNCTFAFGSCEALEALLLGNSLLAGQWVIAVR